MNRKAIWTLTLFVVGILATGCSGQANEPVALLPVTVVPPVTYPTIPPTPPPLPTATPYAAPTSAQVVIPQQQLPEVRAGEVDDNARWSEYLGFRRDYRGPQVHDVDISERYLIQALDNESHPILDAVVTIWDGQQQIWQSRTMSDGTTMFFPRAMGATQSSSFTVSVNKGGSAHTFSMPRWGQEHWIVQLDQRQSQSQQLNLDVLFLLDSTGSMGDEIAALQSSILSIADQIDRLRPRPDLRFGLVTFRDRVDQYVVKRTEFTSDINAFRNQLNNVQAGGGGDYPESVNEALHVALHDMDWQEEESVPLIFLVGDAPPHLDYGQDFDYAQEMAVAAANGIKIFPIAASGTDEQAEYIFRQLAQFTQGRFIFLTYDEPTNGGEPGDVSTMSVSSYGVQDLDDLVIRLVTEELAPQSYRQ